MWIEIETVVLVETDFELAIIQIHAEKSYETAYEPLQTWNHQNISPSDKDHELHQRSIYLSSQRDNPVSDKLGISFVSFGFIPAASFLAKFIK